MEKTMINKIEKILDTLPISYYLGGKLNKVSLTNDMTSWFNPMTLEIGISLPQLIATKDFGKNDLEDDIRCMLYHEVSHAILTPKCLKPSAKLNIFEDERIETVCKNYYMRTNFKQFVKRVNNFKGEKPTSAMELFYQIVRYRKGPQQFVDEVERIINRFKRMTYTTEYWYTVSNYTDEVNRLYLDIERYFEKMKDIEELTKSEHTSTLSDKSETNLSATDCDGLETNTIENDEVDENDGNIEETKDDEEVLPKEEIQEMFKSVLTTYNNDTFRQTIKKILHQESSMEHANGSAINAYTGRIDIRSCGRDDYKYFVRSNRQGNVKQFTKKKLNLFIDRSGSFESSEQKVNELLFELVRLEKEDKNFSFDLVTCGVGETYQNKNERTLKCNGGNRLDEHIFDLFRQVQDNQAKNYNIILFDGDAFSDCWPHFAYWKNFGAFNNNNCVIISDYSNQEAIETYAKNAKHIFTRKYTLELEKNIEIALQSLIR